MTDYKENTRKTFNRQAATYDTAACGRHARALYAAVLAQLAQIPHGTVLDVGCGTGELVKGVMEAHPEAECTGLDLSEKMLAVAKGKLGGRAELVQGDVERLPFEDGRFDAVLCTDSFHHYPNPEKALGEIGRVLKPGGVFLLADCTAPGPVRALMNLLLPLGDGGDVRIYGEAEIRALLGKVFHGPDWRRVSTTAYLAWGIR